MEKKLLFLHIPKTAGTSVVRLIERNYPQEACQSLYNQETFEDNLRAGLKNPKVKALYGHFFFQPIFRDLKEELYLFTFLRQPQSWQVSNYLHIKYSSDPYHQAWRAQWNSFSDYLDDKQANNRQTRMLSGTLAYKHFAADLPAALARAKENLQLMQAVGFSEKFGASIKKISTDLGWKQHSSLRENVNNHRLEARYLSLRYRKKLERVCYYDQQLYNYAREKFGNA